MTEEYAFLQQMLGLLCLGIFTDNGTKQYVAQWYGLNISIGNVQQFIQIR